VAEELQVDQSARPVRSWLQVSLGSLLAFVLGMGVGLAVKHQFAAPEQHRLPDPSNIRLGQKVTVEVTGNVPEFAFNRTSLVLADGTISLPGLRQVPAAGLSLDQLTDDLTKRYLDFYRFHTTHPRVQVFVSFEDSSVRD
jgi:hypothetical protein